jgi:alginate O-acetyltransferase complex protein AlgI
MLFNSLIFLYAFLPITYLGFWILRTKTSRYVWLTLTGYVFYGSWNYKFCTLMAFSTVVAYVAGRGLLKWQAPWQRRLCLIVPVTVDLALLGFFKYTGFALETSQSLVRLLGFDVTLPVPQIVLPVGISFYTFHTITYIVDSYRGVVTPTRNFFELSCYVSLFAQLVAGPIVRFRQIERDLEAIEHADRRAGLNIGWSFFAIGLIKKVLIADTIASVIDPALANYHSLSSAGTWMCVLGYTYQLYFDFSGYSDMAIGLGHMFGLRLPQNFNSPYKAIDISDFWRRWHISLSTVLRDYLYIPLGGGRGSALFVYRNLMITMLLGGLWHGANWTFVVWGAYHGALLIMYRLLGPGWDAMPVAVKRLATFLLVVVGWVFFRATDFSMAATLLHRMFVPSAGTLPVGAPLLLGMLLLAGLIAHFAPNMFELDHQWSPASVLAWSLLFVICLFAIYGNGASPFLYFQF